MTLNEANKILADALVDTGLARLTEYLSFRKGECTATLDGDFSADELEAIAIYMRSTAGFVFPIVARCPNCGAELHDASAIGRRCPMLRCAGAIIEAIGPSV